MQTIVRRNHLAIATGAMLAVLAACHAPLAHVQIVSSQYLG
jgi:hypothetical protein